MWFTPKFQIAHTIAAKNQMPFTAWLSLTQITKRIDCVTEAFTILLAGIDSKLWLVCYSKLQHRYSIVKTGNRAVVLVRRPWRGNKQEPIKLPLFPALFGKDKVSDMDGVKRSTKDANTHD